VTGLIASYNSAVAELIMHQKGGIEGRDVRLMLENEMSCYENERKNNDTVVGLDNEHIITTLDKVRTQYSL
jgi:hypothetical protein